MVLYISINDEVTVWVLARACYDPRQAMALLIRGELEVRGLGNFHRDSLVEGCLGARDLYVEGMYDGCACRAED